MRKFLNKCFVCFCVICILIAKIAPLQVLAEDTVESLKSEINTLKTNMATQQGIYKDKTKEKAERDAAKKEYNNLKSQLASKQKKLKKQEDAAKNDDADDKVYASSDLKKFTGNISGKAGDVGSKTSSILAAVLHIMRVVGTGVSIIILIWVGIKYMVSAPSERAEFKKSATAYIVGAIILFSTTTLLQILSKFTTTSLSN